MKFFLLFLFAIGIYQISLSQPAPISVEPNPTLRQLQMPWRHTIAVGRAHNLLRADILEHLAIAQQAMGYRYCRFHAIFDDQMDVVRRDKQSGKLIFNWHQVDKVYDALLKLGIRPFVELNPMPAALASGTQTMFFYKMNVTPPKSYEEWGELVTAFVQHLVQRYGYEEVRRWYFEVWNEPNLSAFWSGTQADYWKLYTTSAKAIKALDTAFQVGGPATASGAWVKEIIEYCTANNVPLDFVSTHLYPQDEQVFYPDRKDSPHKLGSYFSDRFREVQQLVRKSRKPHLPIYWTEWNTQSASSAKNITWGDNIYVDNLFAASFIARNMTELDTVAQSMAYWVVSDIFDEGGIPQSPFSSTYGLLTIHGIPKASFQAFRLLRKMTGNIMAVRTAAQLPNGKGLLVTREGNTTNVLLWNQAFVEEKAHTGWTSSIQLPLSNDTSFSLVKATLGIGHGSAWESWQLLGRPLNPTPVQLELLQQHSEPAYSLHTLKPINKTAIVSFTLRPGEVQYWQISPTGHSATTRFVNPDDFKLWDEGMTERKN